MAQQREIEEAASAIDGLAPLDQEVEFNEEDRGLSHKRKNKKGVAAGNQAELQEKAREDQEKRERKAKVVQAPKPK